MEFINWIYERTKKKIDLRSSKSVKHKNGQRARMATFFYSTVFFWVGVKIWNEGM